jgi:hypothetical protein
VWRGVPSSAAPTRGRPASHRLVWPIPGKDGPAGQHGTPAVTCPVELHSMAMLATTLDAFLTVDTIARRPSLWSLLYAVSYAHMAISCWALSLRMNQARWVLTVLG